MKQQPLSSRHDRHDVLLIARFYGGDVSDAEREQAVALVGGCEECAALFADLGAIAATTRQLPTPPRPRDFTLTEADAARLTRSAGSVRRWSWPVLRRSFGGALTAIGLVGVLLSGGSALLGPTSHANEMRDTAQAGSEAQTSGPALVPAAAATPAAAAATPSPAANFGAATPKSASQPSSIPATVNGGSTAAAATSGSGGQTATDMSSGSGGATTSTAGGQILGGTEGTGQSIATASSGGVDGRTLGLFGFGIALLLGVALLAGPRLLRLTGRRIA